MCITNGGVGKISPGDERGIEYEHTPYMLKDKERVLYIAINQ